MQTFLLWVAAVASLYTGGAATNPRVSRVTEVSRPGPAGGSLTGIPQQPGDGTEQETPYFCQATSGGRYLITRVFRARLNYDALRQRWRDFLQTAPDRNGRAWGTDGDDRTDCFPGIADIEGRRQNQIVHYRQQGLSIEEINWTGTVSVTAPGPSARPTVPTRSGSQSSAVEHARAWRPVGQSSNARAYIDENSIRRIGDRVRFWHEVRYGNPQGDSGHQFDRVRTWMEIDCRAQTWRSIETLVDLGERRVDSFSSEEAFQQIRTGTPGQLNLRATCLNEWPGSLQTGW